MNFYVVNNFGFNDNGFAYDEEKKGKIKTGSAVKCEECGAFLTGLEWLPPLNIKLSRGRLGDVIFGAHNHFIVSEKFRDLYVKNGFTGILSFQPVSMFQKRRLVNEKYYYPKIVLSDVLVDLEKSKVVLDGVAECSRCQKAGRPIKKIEGLYFIDEEKIKEDIFCTKMLPGDIIFSERFKIAAKDLLNLSFVDSKTYKSSWGIFDE